MRRELTFLDPSILQASSIKKRLEIWRPAWSAPPTGEEGTTKEDNNGEITALHLKCFVCLFLCASTRAVHLELVPDLSARSYLLAFCRFAASQWPISVMYSDNAQTFRCVSRHLNKRQADPTIQDLITRRILLLIFFANLAPWWGGFGNEGCGA